MLYRFQSRASADFVMLEVHARQLLDIVGKSVAPQGIITVEQIPGAISALEAALAREGGNTHNHDDYAVEGHANDAEKQHVGCTSAQPPCFTCSRTRWPRRRT
jgi:hypothetical protein